MTVEYSDKNIEKLAREIVDSWDMETLIEFAVDKLINTYWNDEELFNSDKYIIEEN